MIITDEMLYSAAAEAAELFLDTLPQREICDQSFSQTFQEKMQTLLARENPGKRRRRVRLLIIAAVVTALILGGVVGASAEFRQWVISLFTVQQVEQVPPPPVQDVMPDKTDKTVNITQYAVSDIGELLDVQYLVSKQYMDSFGPLFYSCEDGVTTFYEAVDDKFLPIPSARVQQEVTVQGVTAVLDYTWCQYNGEVYFHQEEECELPSPDGAGYYFYLTREAGDLMVIFCRGRQSETWEYRVLLDPETGKITDFLADVTVNGQALSDIPYISSWEKVADRVYTVRMAVEPMEWDEYLVDWEKNTAVSFRELCGMKRTISNVKYVDGYYMLFDRNEDLSFDYWRYNPADGSCVQLYDNALDWNTRSSDSGAKWVSFAGGRYHFLKTGGELFLVDEITGGRMTVEGLTEEMADSALIDHQSGERLLISQFEDDGIGRIGVIDISDRKFYLLERESAPGVFEYSISWCEGAIQIAGHDAAWKTNYMYLYHFRE